jgi:hypothetical protein
MKNFYVRNVVKQVGRPDYWENIKNEGQKELMAAADENYKTLKSDYVEDAEKRGLKKQQ